jgi:hypothetical protein
MTDTYLFLYQLGLQLFNNLLNGDHTAYTMK